MTKYDYRPKIFAAENMVFRLHAFSDVKLRIEKRRIQWAVTHTMRDMKNKNYKP